MEKAIERLEQYRDRLRGEIKRLDVDTYDIGMNIGMRRDYVASLKREIKKLGKTYQTLLNLSRKIPGLKPALNPVHEKIMMNRFQIECKEEELRILARSYKEKRILLKDMLRDMESIELYLGSREYCQEKGLEYDIQEEKAFDAEEFFTEADKKENPIQRVG